MSPLRAIQVLALACFWWAMTDSTCAENWPNWRGPRGDGTSSETKVPTAWNGESGENIAWKTRIPGSGHGSPIVWDNHVFLASCLETTEDRLLICVDRESGKVVWQRVVVRAPLERKQIKNSYASSTPATDGQRVYVTFLEPDGTKGDVPWKPNDYRSPGNMVVAAYDLEGELQWLERPAKFVGINGYRSCPVLVDDLVIVNGDQDGVGYLVALEAATGRVRWKIDRRKDVRLGSFVTPIVRRFAGREQLVLAGNGSFASFDPRDGSTHWFMDSPSIQFIASPVASADLVFIAGGHPKREVVAVRPNGEGNVTDKHVAWRTPKASPFISSPILVGERLLGVTDAGIASCFDAASGEREWMERLGGEHYAPPVAAGGLVYFTAVDGVTRVVRVADTFEIVAENPLGGECYASAAISAGQFFLRSMGDLYCIQAGKQTR